MKITENISLRLWRKNNIIQKRNNIKWIAIACILLFAAIFLSVGIVISISDKNAKSTCTEEVTATVIENVKISTRTNGHHSISYKPVLQYDYNGKTYTSEPSYSTNPPVFSEGDTTKIFINPSSPQKIYVPQMKAGTILSIVFTSIGILALIAAVVVFIIMHK